MSISPRNADNHRFTGASVTLLPGTDTGSTDPVGQLAVYVLKIFYICQMLCHQIHTPRQTYPDDPNFDLMYLACGTQIS